MGITTSFFPQKKEQSEKRCHTTTKFRLSAMLLQVGRVVREIVEQLPNSLSMAAFNIWTRRIRKS